jgi:hypothetical protein
MAAERRSLTAGLSVVPPGADPEAVKAFITQEPKEKAKETEERRPAPEPLLPPSEPEYAGEAKLPRKKRSRKGMVPVGLIPVTVRLSPEIAGALKRLSLERQLAGAEPATQQEIVEEALAPLLRSEGVL